MAYKDPEQQRAYKAVYDAAHRAENAAYNAAYRASHREELAAYNAAYNTAHREETAVYNAAYYATRREERLAYNAAYRASHREETVSYNSAYAKANPDKRADMQATRRARKADAFIEAIDRQIVFARDQGACGICRIEVEPANWHLDHVIPLSKGGLHSYDNVQVSHPSCNLRKSDHYSPN